MSTLGIGVRVWVGWCPAKHVDEWAAFARLRVGLIVEGPISPGEGYLNGSVYQLNGLPEPKWKVGIDGESVYAAESLLTPIDDDDAVHEDEQLKVRA